MNPAAKGLPVVDLRPGEIHIAPEPTLITTLLGSCVGVCLYSSSRKIGAMSHSVLPVPHNSLCESDVRYVECALERILMQLKGMEVPRHDIKAKIFGGAQMFHVRGGPARLVGEGNVEAARRFLKAARVGIVSEGVGGMGGRKLYFNSATGEVVVRNIAGGPRP